MIFPSCNFLCSPPSGAVRIAGALWSRGQFSRSVDRNFLFSPDRNVKITEGWGERKEQKGGKKDKKEEKGERKEGERAREKKKVGK